jgi:hypothetical protein
MYYFEKRETIASSQALCVVRLERLLNFAHRHQRHGFLKDWLISDIH